MLTILFVGVYTAFSSSIRLWRLGEANLMVYQDARMSLSMLTRELENVLPGSAYLMEGTNDSIEFFAVVPPMDVEEGEGPRPMWVRYRLKQGGLGEKATLVREEKVVESPLPAKPPENGKIDRTIIETGRKHSFDLASGVARFRLAYYWAPEPEKRSPLDKGAPPEPIRFVVKDEHEEGWGMPQGIKATMRLVDPNSDEGTTEFTTFIAFRGPTTPLEALQDGGEDVLR